MSTRIHRTALSSKARRLGVGLGLSSALSLFGCGVEFDSVAQIEGVRILAIQKRDSYAQPGDQVQMRMLVHDTGVRGSNEAEGDPRELSLFWLSGCENPPGDLYAFCIEGFREAFVDAGLADSLSELAELDEADQLALLELLAETGIRFGTQETFSLRVSEDIISRRPPPPPGVLNYGLNYVFFAACAGRLTVDFAGTEFPLRCVDDDGVPVPPRDFVAGYTSVFSYEELTNSNPVISGIEVEGEPLSPEQFCVGEECQTLRPDPTRECEAGDPSVERCADEDDTASCDKLKFKVLVDPDSVDEDGLLTLQRERPSSEMMWVNYHTDRGKMKFDLGLVNDLSTGFNPDPETEYVAPRVPGPAHVWAVVRDNRGGKEWARFRVCVEE